MDTKIGVLSFLALFRSIHPSRTSFKTKQVAGDDQRRAYLTLTESNVRWADPIGAKARATVELKWVNVGRTAATNIGFSHALEFLPANQEASAATNPGFIWWPQPGDKKLEPGDSIDCEAGQIPPGIVKKWKAGERAVLVFSAVVYTDVMGKENRVETCNFAIYGEVDGEAVVTFKAAEFNNSSIYGIDPKST